MRTSLLRAIAWLFVALAVNGAAADGPIESLVDKEHLWLLQAGEAQPVYAWFERRAGTTALVYRTEGTADANAVGRIPASALAVVATAPLQLAGPGGVRVVPAWVVPTRGSRSGH